MAQAWWLGGGKACTVCVLLPINSAEPVMELFISPYVEVSSWLSQLNVCTLSPSLEPDLRSVKSIKW